MEQPGWLAFSKSIPLRLREDFVLRKRMVEKPAANILFKLGLTSRSQIVRWPIEKGLVQAYE